MIKEFYEQFYAHKLDNLDEMDKFFDRHSMLKPTQNNKLAI